MKPIVVAWIALGVGVLALAFSVFSFVQNAGTFSRNPRQVFGSGDEARGECFLADGTDKGTMTLAQCKTAGGTTIILPDGTHIGPPL